MRGAGWFGLHFCTRLSTSQDQNDEQVIQRPSECMHSFTRVEHQSGIHVFTILIPKSLDDAVERLPFQYLRSPRAASSIILHVRMHLLRVIGPRHFQGTHSLPFFHYRRTLPGCGSPKVISGTDCIHQTFSLLDHDRALFFSSSACLAAAAASASAFSRFFFSFSIFMP